MACYNIKQQRQDVYGKKDITLCWHDDIHIFHLSRNYKRPAFYCLSLAWHRRYSPHPDRNLPSARHASTLVVQYNKRAYSHPSQPVLPSNLLTRVQNPVLCPGQQQLKLTRLRQRQRYHNRHYTQRSFIAVSFHTEQLQAR